MPLDYIEFSKKIKAKYPEYSNVDDLTLAKKMVEKYPEYKDQVSLDPIKKKEPTASPSGQPKAKSSSATSGKETGKPSVGSGLTSKGGVWGRMEKGKFVPISDVEYRAIQKVQAEREKVISKAKESELKKSISESEKTLGIVNKALGEDKKQSDAPGVRKDQPAGLSGVLDPMSEMSTKVSSQVKAITEVGADANESQLKKAEEKYKAIAVQSNLKEKGYDIDVDGDLNSDKTKRALSKERLKNNVYSKRDWSTEAHSNDVDTFINKDVSSENINDIVDYYNSKFSSQGYIFSSKGGRTLSVKYEPSPMSVLSEKDFDVLNFDNEELKSYMKESMLTNKQRQYLFGTDSENYSDVDRVKYNMDLLKIVSDSPNKFSSEFKEDVITMVDSSKALVKMHEDISSYEKSLNSKASKLDSLQKEYERTGDESIKEDILKLTQEILIQDIEKNKMAQSLKKAGGAITKISGKALEESIKDGNVLGYLTGKFALGFTSVPKMATSLAMEIMPGVLGPESIMPTNQYNELKAKGLSDYEITDLASKELKRNILSDVEKGIVNVASLGSTTKEHLDYYDYNDITKAAGFLAESIGTSMSAGGNSALQKIAFFAMSYNAMEDQMRGKEFDGLTEMQKKLISVPYALVIGRLEKLGFDIMKSGGKTGPLSKIVNNVIANSLTNLPKNASIEAIEMEINKEVSKMIAMGTIRVVNGALSEGFVEGTQQLSEITMKNISNWIIGKDEKTGLNYFKDVPDITTADGIIKAWEASKEDAYYGALGGLLFSGAQVSRKTLSDAVYEPQRDEDFSVYSKSILDDNLRELIKNNVITKLSNGEISKEDAEAELKSIDEIHSVLSKIDDNLSVRDQRNSFNLLLERGKLESEIKGKDENLVARQKERITEINNTLQNISRNAVQEQATSEVLVQPEATVGEEVVEGKPEPQVTTEEGKKEVTAKAVETNDAKTYSEALAEARTEMGKEGPGLELQVSPVSEQEAQKIIDDGGKIFMTEDGQAGAYVKKDGYMGGLFKNPKSNFKDVAKVLQQARIKAGGYFMDGYATKLEEIYVKNGFRPVARLKFNEEYAPEGWNAESSPLKNKPDVVFFAYDPNGDYKVGDGQYLTDYDQAYDQAKNYTTKPDTELTLENAEEFTKAAAEIGDTALKISKAAKSVLRALPGIKVHLHKDTDSYKNGVARASGQTKEQIDASESDAQSAGSYVNGEIHVDLSNPNATLKTLYHEAFHHAVTKMAPKTGELRQMVNGLKKALSGKHDDMVKQIEEFEAMYTGDLGYVDVDRAEEFLSELMGTISEDAEQLDVTTLQKIANVINKIADKLIGRPIFSEAASRQEIVDFMNAMSKGLREGKEVNINDLGLSGVINVSESTKRKKSIVGDIIRFDTNKNTKLEENVPLSRFNGKITNTIESDRMTGGYIKDDSGVILFKFLGGVHFPVITGKWWASQSASKAKKVATNANNNRDADGFIYGTPMVGSEKQHMSNNDMLLATTELMKLDATSRNTKVTKADVIDLIYKAFKKKGLQKKSPIIKSVIKKSNSIGNIFDELEYILFQDGDSIVDRNGDPILDSNGSKISKLTFEQRKSIIETLLGNAKVKDVNFPSAGNSYDAALRFAEPITGKAKKIGDVVTVMRTKGTLKYKKTDKADEFYHKSYPYEIYAENEDGSQAEIEVFILDAAYSMRDVLPELRKSSGDKFTWDEYLEKHGPKSEKIAEAQYNRTAKLSVASGEIKVPKVKKQLLAPNGKPSNLNEKQWHQVRTPEFKKWFGDWENDPKNASKVVDENGEPKLMYHGTKSIFDEFDINYGSSNTKAKNGKLGFFFTDSKKVADSFGDNILQVFINMRNPIDAGYFTYNIDGDIDKSRTVDGYITQKNAILKTSGKDNWEDINSEDIDIWREKIQSLGYDGLIMYTQTDSKEIVSTGTKRGYLKPHAMHIAFNPNQIKSATENVGTFSPEEKSIRKQISNSAIDKAKEKYNLSIERGNSIEKARESAMADLKKNEWYAKADDTQREDAVRKLREFFGLKEKKSPTAEKATGKPKPKKITVSDTTALKDQIRLEARAARESRLDLKGKQTALSTAIKEMKRGGFITAQQATSLVSRITKLNVDNAVHVEEFLAYAERLFNNAEYNEKLKNANILRAKIKKLLKSDKIQASVVSAAKEFSKISPKSLMNIDEYLENAEKVYDAVRPSRAESASVNFRSAVKISELGDYTQRALNEQEEYRKNQLLAVHSSLEAEGILSKDMSFNEMMEVISSLQDTDEKISADKKNAQVMAYIANVFEMYRPIVESILKGVDPFTDEDVEVSDRAKEIMTELMDIDVQQMKSRDAIRVIEAIDNFVTNGITDGVEAITSYYKGEANAKAKSNVKARSLTMFGKQTDRKASFGKNWARNMMSIKTLSDLMFRGVNAASEMLDAMGISKFENGVAKATKLWTRALETYDKSFLKKKANGKNFMDAENIIERGMYAFLKRTVVGDQKAVDTELNRRINLIKQSVEVLRKHGTDRQKKMADIYEALIDKLGLNDSNLSITDIEARVDSVNRDAVDWWVNTWGEHYGDLVDVSENVYNTKLDKDLNYSPDKYSRIMQTEMDVEAIMEQGGGGFSSAMEFVYDKKTGVLMPSTKPASMEDRRFVDLNFDTNNSTALKAALVDINTASATRQIKGFLSSDAMNDIIESQTDRKIFMSRVYSYIMLSRNKKVATNSELVEAFEPLTRLLGTLGASRALGQALMPLKQTVPVALNTLINAGRLDLITPGDKFNQWLENSGMSIANRGMESSSGIESANKLIDDAIENGKINKAIETVSNVNSLGLKWLISKPDVWIARSSFKSYYLQKLKQKGVSTDIDWETHEIDMDAANYAQHMVDRQQNVSDTALSGQFFSSPDGVVKLMRNLFFPFTTFVINQKSRMFSDFATLSSSQSSSQDKKIAARSLGGLLTEMATFHAMSLAIRYAIINQIVQAITGEDDDDEELAKKILREESRFVTSMVNDVFSPLPQLDTSVDKLAQFLYDMSTEDSFDEQAERMYEAEMAIRAAEGKEPLDKENYKKKYIDNNLRLKIEAYQGGGSFGSLGITFQQLQELKKSYDFAFNGEYETGEGVTKTTKYVADKYREPSKQMFYWNLAYNVLGFPRELSNVSRGVDRQIQKKHGMTEKAYETTKELKGGKDLNKLEEYLVTKIRATKDATAVERIKEELKWIEDNGGLTDSQVDKYIEIYERDGSVVYSDLQKIKK